MKSTLVHVSLNEITVSFQLCTISVGGQSGNKLYMSFINIAFRWFVIHVSILNVIHNIWSSSKKGRRHTRFRNGTLEITVLFPFCTIQEGATSE